MSEEVATNEKIRIVVLTDIHSGKKLDTRPGEQAFDLLNEFVEKANTEIKPDIVVELGDRFNSETLDIDRKNAIRIRDILNKLEAPFSPILGNHDIELLSVEDNETIYGCSMKNRVQYINGFKLIFLNAQDPVIEKVGGELSEESLEWVELELKKDSAPTIIFCHQALDEQEIMSNMHFCKIPDLAFVKNRERMRNLFIENGNIVGVINGHLHWTNLWFENEIPYISAPSFIETWEPNRDAPGAFTCLEIDNNSIDIRCYTVNPNITTSRCTINRK